MNSTMMWVAGLAIAGMATFFNLKSNVAVVSERENNHFGQVQLQLTEVNKKLDILLGNQEKLGVIKEKK